MRCGHCPRPGLPCRGEAVPRLCELVDPTSAGRRPEYLAALAIDEAPDPAPPPLPLAVAIEANRRGLLNCPDAEPASCSCEGSAYCRRRDRPVGLRDCASCLGLTDSGEEAI